MSLIGEVYSIFLFVMKECVLILEKQQFFPLYCGYKLWTKMLTVTVMANGTKWAFDMRLMNFDMRLMNDEDHFLS